MKFYDNGVEVTAQQAWGHWSDHCEYLGIDVALATQLWEDMLTEEGEDLRDIYLSDINIEIVFA